MPSSGPEASPEPPFPVLAACAGQTTRRTQPRAKRFLNRFGSHTEQRSRTPQTSIPPAAYPAVAHLLVDSGPRSRIPLAAPKLMLVNKLREMNKAYIARD